MQEQHEELPINSPRFPSWSHFTTSAVSFSQIRSFIPFLNYLKVTDLSPLNPLVCISPEQGHCFLHVHIKIVLCIRKHSILCFILKLLFSLQCPLENAVIQIKKQTLIYFVIPEPIQISPIFLAMSPGLSGWTPCNHNDIYKGRGWAGGSEKEEEIPRAEAGLENDTKVPHYQP